MGPGTPNNDIGPTPSESTEANEITNDQNRHESALPQTAQETNNVTNETAFMAVEIPVASNGSFKGGKLRGPDNYSIWSFQMATHLKARGLWGAVTPKPEHEQTPLTACNEQNSQVAYGELVASLTDEMVFTIIDKETPKQVWDALKTACRASASANRHFLAKEFRSKEYAASTGIRAHLNSMKDLRMQLIGAGQNITEEDFVSTTLASIRHPDFEPVINVLTIARKEELTFDEMQAELTLQEMRLAKRGHRHQNPTKNAEAAFNVI